MTKRTVVGTSQTSLESGDVEIVGGEKEFSLATGDAQRAFEPGDIDTDRVIGTAELDLEVFMHDKITIELNEPATEDEAQFAEVTVNGDRRVALRGTEVTWPRKHIAVLASAKVMRVKQKKIVLEDGSMGYQESTVSALAYPFRLVDDPRGRTGAAWLKQQLANPV